ncbi:hypothetical protein EVAR_41967_1 [Eumeta japonica]|uniref:Uncharacterized protein n=1 Tax=Eumeta variegata TaxID=151549 RepID=A0A4C1WTB0_EUMVA|nr:hypothetical protein EVAR_41967_1 [Eumeta japonica]
MLPEVINQPEILEFTLGEVLNNVAGAAARRRRGGGGQRARRRVLSPQPAEGGLSALLRRAKQYVKHRYGGDAGECERGAGPGGSGPLSPLL